MAEAHRQKPSHYPQGQDSFAWAEERFSKEQLTAIAEFNIHKYLTRNKGQDLQDLLKIEVYSHWIGDILLKDE